jgi:hypothetical protein
MHETVPPFPHNTVMILGYAKHKDNFDRVFMLFVQFV